MKKCGIVKFNFFFIFRIPREEFLQVSRDIHMYICQIFKKEQESSYYTPSKRDNNGNPISAHGKLWDKYQLLLNQNPRKIQIYCLHLFFITTYFAVQ